MRTNNGPLQSTENKQVPISKCCYDDDQIVFEDTH